MDTTKVSSQTPSKKPLTKIEIALCCSVFLVFALIASQLAGIMKAENAYNSGVIQITNQVQESLSPTQLNIFKAVNRNIASNKCLRAPDTAHHTRYLELSRSFPLDKPALSRLGAQAWTKCFNEQLSLVSPGSGPDIQALVQISQEAGQLFTSQ